MFLIKLMLTTYFFQFLWTPYRANNISCLITIDFPDDSRVVVPLIFFSTVEFHQPNRIMRQFGLGQPIPVDPLNLDDVHKDDMRGRTDRYWPYNHPKWIVMWNGPPNLGAAVWRKRSFA